MQLKLVKIGHSIRITKATRDGPGNSLVLGVPSKVMRLITAKERIDNYPD
ncbi:hypothetical protein [Limosilactobacillus kribbianus]